VMMGLQYLLVIYLVAIGFFSPVLLVVLAALTAVPLVWAVYKAPKPEQRPEGYDPNTWPLYYVALAFLHNRRFGLWYLAGIILDVALRLAHVI